eukprot:15143953-Alexandrium_andersonii.AAC.1
MGRPQLLTGQATDLFSGAEDQPSPVAPDPQVVLPIRAEEDAALVARSATPLLPPVGQALAGRERAPPWPPLAQHRAAQGVAHLEL